MENPEEVLQALDEFQKMRPSEIPRELEDYLCWVAKTGDPVYQWSLIKPLFREKLTRVMTDFYESCPSLELAPCPNVEQFNYDIMKCNLLELLESFANAPFTVQRICELLTSPRKEYNRVDKFMRAIEKNILVVSTKEPAARRSENGDGMVNGSFDEEPTVAQPSHDVEMESWVKDCTTGNPVAIPPGDLESPVLDSILSVSAAGKVAKIGSTTDEISRSDIVDAAIDSREIIDSSNLSLPAQNRDEAICVQNLSGNGTVESSAIAPDVPEAVMNEDTSSQPSLDSETEDTESIVSRKLLQTTFRTKDFVKTDGKPVKLYGVDEDEDDEEEEDEEDDEEDEDHQEHRQHEEEEEEEEEDKKKKKKKKKRSRVEEASDVLANSIPSSIRSPEDTMTIDRSKISSIDCQRSDVPAIHVIREKRPRTEDDGANEDSETIDENTRLTELHHDSPAKKNCSVISGFAERLEDPFLVSSVTMKSTEDTMDDNSALPEATTPSCDERLTSSESPKVEENDEATTKEDTGVSIDDRSDETSQNSRPIVEEPTVYEVTNDGETTTSKTSTLDSEKQHEEQQESGVTIEEAMDDETRINKSIVPDPIPIIEEPKDPEPPRQSDSESTTVITELFDVAKNQTEIIDILETRKAIDSAIVVVEESSLTGSMTEDIANVGQATGQDDITDTVQCTGDGETDEKIQPAESMEVDGEESLPVFHQDEPMEQEPPGDMVKS